MKDGCCGDKKKDGSRSAMRTLAVAKIEPGKAREIGRASDDGKVLRISG